MVHLYHTNAVKSIGYLRIIRPGDQMIVKIRRHRRHFGVNPAHIAEHLPRIRRVFPLYGHRRIRFFRLVLHKPSSCIFFCPIKSPDVPHAHRDAVYPFRCPLCGAAFSKISRNKYTHTASSEKL